jgi:iron complex transport system substrate-binding protein
MYPQKIVCLTEESVEIIYALGEQHRIKGVSSYVERPPEAKKLPKVSVFTTSQFDKIDQIAPDLILGFSDIQSDISKELVKRGHNVFIANHRSIEEILNYTGWLSGMLGMQQQGEELVTKLTQIINEQTKKRHKAPRVYFEEWDDPMICNIRWVSEIIQVAGGEDIFAEKAQGAMAKERFVTSEEVIAANPDIIFACWCGKKAKLDQLKSRPGWEGINAIKNNQVYELDPAVFLQPGPAPIVDGLKILNEYFDKLS